MTVYVDKSFQYVLDRDASVAATRAAGREASPPVSSGACPGSRFPRSSARSASWCARSRASASRRARPRSTTRREFPWDLVELLREHDLFGLLFEEEHGGTGTGALMPLVAIEEISKACATTALILAVQELGSLGAQARRHARSSRQRYLPRLASGEWLPPTR